GRRLRFPALARRPAALGRSTATLGRRAGLGGRSLRLVRLGHHLPPEPPTVVGPASRLVDDLIALLAHAHPPAVGQPPDAGPRGLVALAADQHHVGHMQRPLPLDDAALPHLLGGPLVLLDEVHPLHHHPLARGEDDEHLPPLALLLAGD